MDAPPGREDEAVRLGVLARVMSGAGPPADDLGDVVVSAQEPKRIDGSFASARAIASSTGAGISGCAVRTRTGVSVTWRTITCRCESERNGGAPVSIS